MSANCSLIHCETLQAVSWKTLLNRPYDSMIYLRPSTEIWFFVFPPLKYKQEANVTRTQHKQVQSFVLSHWTRVVSQSISQLESFPTPVETVLFRINKLIIKYTDLSFIIAYGIKCVVYLWNNSDLCRTDGEFSWCFWDVHIYSSVRVMRVQLIYCLLKAYSSHKSVYINWESVAKIALNLKLLVLRRT